MNEAEVAMLHGSLLERGKGARGWANSWTEIEYLGDGKFSANVYVGRQAFKDKSDDHWKKRKLIDERPTKDYILVQSAKCCAEIYPYYAKYFDVHHEEVRLYEERWVVQRWRDPPGKWFDVGAWNPVTEVEEGPDFIRVSVTYNTDYGPLTVEYLQRDGCALKHNVIFKNTTGSPETFRVQQKWAGIVGEKCNGRNIPLDIEEPFLVFHRADKPRREFTITENLWSMMFNPDGSKKTDQCLQGSITIESHAQGMKVDFTYGDWVLGENESLEVDPALSTNIFPSDDSYARQDYPAETYGGLDYMNVFHIAGDEARGYMKFDISSLPVCTITKAEAHVRYQQENGNMTVQIRSVTDDGWNEGTLCWNNKKPMIATLDSKVFVEGISWEEFTVTAFVQAQQAGDEVVSLALYGPNHDLSYCYVSTKESEWDPHLYIEYLTVPTVTTQAATGIHSTKATLNGTITATGGENNDERGFDWDYDSGAPYANEWTEVGAFGAGSFSHAFVGFTAGVIIYFRAKTHNSQGWAYGGELSVQLRWANKIFGVEPAKIFGILVKDIAKVQDVED